MKSLYLFCITALFVAFSINLNAQFGKVLVLNGTDQYLEFNEPAVSGLDLTSSGTIEAWVHPCVLNQGNNMIYAKNWCGAGGGYYMRLWDTNGLLEFCWSAGMGCDEVYGFIADSASVPVGQWSHIAVSFDQVNLRAGTGLTLYVNGAPITGHWRSFINGWINSNPDPNSLPTSMVIPTNNEPLLISCYTGWSPMMTYNFFFQGMIDESRVWNVGRTDAEIAADYNHPLVGNEPGLVSYLDMEQANGNVINNITDASLYASGKRAVYYSSFPGSVQLNNFEVNCNMTAQQTIEHERYLPISPNPSNGYFHIDTQGLSFENKNLIIKDITGKTIMIVNLNSNNYGFYIDASSLPNGLYFVGIEGDAQNVQWTSWLKE